MNPWVKLVGFAAALLAVFAAGLGLGGMVDPGGNTAGDPPAHSEGERPSHPDRHP